MKKENLPQNGKKKTILVTSIVVVSFLAVSGIGYFFYLIYHKDQPTFVPGDTRGDIRESIKENIAEPLADVWPAVGEPLVEAVYTAPANATGTEGWQSYINADLGIELKYPEGWKTKPQFYDNSPVNQLGFITVDPFTDRLNDAQISLKVFDSELYMVEDSELSDVVVQEKRVKELDNVSGQYYKVDAVIFDGNTTQTSYLWIGQKNGTVYVLTYTPTDTNAALLDYYEEILQNLRFD